MRTAPDRVIAALCTQFDPHATKLVVLETALGRPAVEAALGAGFVELSENGRWVSGTNAGFERWNDIRPQPKPKAPSQRRDLCFEESLIRAEVAVTLLAQAQPGKACAEARRTLNQTAAELMKSYCERHDRPALYEARCLAVDRAMDRLI